MDDELHPHQPAATQPLPQHPQTAPDDWWDDSFDTSFLHLSPPDPNDSVVNRRSAGVPPEAEAPAATGQPVRQRSAGVPPELEPGNPANNQNVVRRSAGVPPEPTGAASRPRSPNDPNWAIYRQPGEDAADYAARLKSLASTPGPDREEASALIRRIMFWGSDEIRRHLGWSPTVYPWQIVAPDDPVAEAAWWRPVRRKVAAIRVLAVVIAVVVTAVAATVGVAATFTRWLDGHDLANEPAFDIGLAAAALAAFFLWVYADVQMQNARRARLRMSISARERARLEAEEAAERERQRRWAEQEAAERARQGTGDQVTFPERKPLRTAAMWYYWNEWENGGPPGANPWRRR